jgi:hypothetical protein
LIAGPVQRAAAEERNGHRAASAQGGRVSSSAKDRAGRSARRLAGQIRRGERIVAERRAVRRHAVRATEARQRVGDRDHERDRERGKHPGKISAEDLVKDPVKDLVRDLVRHLAKDLGRVRAEARNGRSDRVPAAESVVRAPAGAAQEAGGRAAVRSVGLVAAEASLHVPAASAISARDRSRHPLDRGAFDGSSDWRKAGRRLR